MPPTLPGPCANVVPAPLLAFGTDFGCPYRVLAPFASKEGAMSYARQLLDTYPRDLNVDAGVLAATIDALSDCAQACTACADDDLSEPDVAELVKCIRPCLDCADVCTATLRVASRQAEYDAKVARSLLEACARFEVLLGISEPHRGRFIPEGRYSVTWLLGRGGCRRSRSAHRRGGAPGRRRRRSGGGSRRRRCAGR
jgi:hypothetical protein